MGFELVFYKPSLEKLRLAKPTHDALPSLLSLAVKNSGGSIIKEYGQIFICCTQIQHCVCEGVTVGATRHFANQWHGSQASARTTGREHAVCMWLLSIWEEDRPCCCIAKYL